MASEQTFSDAEPITVRDYLNAGAACWSKPSPSRPAPRTCSSGVWNQGRLKHRLRPQQYFPACDDSAHRGLQREVIPSIADVECVLRAAADLHRGGYCEEGRDFTITPSYGRAEFAGREKGEITPGNPRGRTPTSFIRRHEGDHHLREERPARGCEAQDGEDRRLGSVLPFTNGVPPRPVLGAGAVCRESFPLADGASRSTSSEESHDLPSRCRARRWTVCSGSSWSGSLQRRLPGVRGS